MKSLWVLLLVLVVLIGCWPAPKDQAPATLPSTGAKSSMLVDPNQPIGPQKDAAQAKNQVDAHRQLMTFSAWQMGAGLIGLGVSAFLVILGVRKLGLALSGCCLIWLLGGSVLLSRLPWIEWLGLGLLVLAIAILIGWAWMNRTAFAQVVTQVQRCRNQSDDFKTEMDNLPKVDGKRHQNEVTEHLVKQIKAAQVAKGAL